MLKIFLSLSHHNQYMPFFLMIKILSQGKVVNFLFCLSFQLSKDHSYLTDGVSVLSLETNWNVQSLMYENDAADPLSTKHLEKVFLPPFYLCLSISSQRWAI